MNLASLFGLDKVGQQSVQEAHATINEALTKVDPILRNIFNRVADIAHSLLNRFTIDITIKLNPYPKAESVEQEKAREAGQ